MLSSVVHSQIADHAPYRRRGAGDRRPRPCRDHRRRRSAAPWSEAGLGYDGLDGVAATAGPGLVGGVMVGLCFGKAVALARGLPLVAVNHLEGHAVSARLGAQVAYPFLLLLVSGGHCQLLEVRGRRRLTRLGSTIDDAAGEAFDKIAKALGLAYPGGPALERLAAGGDGARFDLPRALLGRKDCDFSFSGLKTAAARLAAGLRDRSGPARPGRRRPGRHRPPARRTLRPGHGGLCRTRTTHRAVRGRRRRRGQPDGPRHAGGDGAPTTASPSPPRRWPTAPTTPP